MPTLRQMADKKVMQAYGTSEGVTRAWDARGRGRKAREQVMRHRLAALPDSEKLRILPADEAKAAVPPVFVGMKKMEGLPPKQMRQEWKEKYDKFGDKLMDMHKKLDNPDEVKSTAGKFMHFLKDIAEWHDAFGNLRDLLLEAGAALYIGIKAFPYAHAGLLNTMVWAHAHIAPVAHMFVSMSGIFSAGELNIKQPTVGEHHSLAAMAYGRTLAEI